MTSTSGATLERRNLTSGAPFAVAFGLALVTSSAVGIAPPVHPWVTTSMRHETSPASPHGRISPNGQTSSGISAVSNAPGSEVAASQSPPIAKIRTMAGLTADQVGRLFGVSRRSVHNWINGSAMAPQHEERAAAILAIMHALPGSTPDERRLALFESRNGTSIFRQLVASQTSAVRLQAAGVTARERIAL